MNSTLDCISCKGVRTHNLKSIDINIPKGKWICVTGVSGSGKSSLAFDTIFAESQRRFLETLGTYERQFLEGIPNGEFDSISNIPPAIALKQSNRSSDPRSLIATAADLAEPLRQLFALTMEPSCAKCGSPVLVSNSSDLLDAVRAALEQNNIQAILLTVPFAWPGNEAQATVIAKTMLASGHSRIVLDNEIVDLEKILNTKKILAGMLPLVLDRISNPISSAELENRVLTAWSQVKHSPHFNTIEISIQAPPESDAASLIRCFQTQPFCKTCQDSTTLIQQSDLDWQSAIGACEVCNGVGNLPTLDKSKIVPDETKSVAENAIKPWSSHTFQWMRDDLNKSLQKLGISSKTPFSELPQDIQDWLWHGKVTSDQFQKKISQVASIKDFFDALEAERYKSSSRILLAKYRRYTTCVSCSGTRLNKAGRNARSVDKNFHDIMNSELFGVVEWLEDVRRSTQFQNTADISTEIFAEVKRKIDILIRLGLGSSSLWRRCKTLSGGEYQRVLLARVLGNGLTDALYVLDEPSVGLGKDELPELVTCLRELRDLGNTILMVEHDRFLIESADDWIELGPGGGLNGGKIVKKKSQMPMSSTPKSPDVGSFKQKTPKAESKPDNHIQLINFSALNCAQLSCSIPIGAITVITGPSGAGKSTLLHMGIDAALTLAQDTRRTSNAEANIDQQIGTWENLVFPAGFLDSTEIISIEQKAAHRSISSILATTLGVMDFLRRQFAQSEDARRHGMSVGDFSFNSAGACATCNGKGEVEEDLFFLGIVEKQCPDCLGSRYSPLSLRARWMNKTIAEWLNMSVDECLSHWDPFPMPRKQLRLATDLGLGYLPIGTATSQLSGGELQRLRMAAALSIPGKKMFCVLDEPTRGLSELDIGNLLESLQRLTRLGHTFVVVEHHEGFCDKAHQLIQMGPKGGKAGGKIVGTLVR